MPKHVVVESCSEVVGGCEGTTNNDPLAHDAEHALNLVQPRCVFGREVSLPTGMFVEPLEYVVGVVSRKVVHDEVAPSVWVTGIDQVEQFYECRRIVVVGGETEELSASNVERAHQAQGSVAQVLELASDWLSRLHRNIGIATFERLDAGLLIEADDMLVFR